MNRAASNLSRSVIISASLPLSSPDSSLLLLLSLSLLELEDDDDDSLSLLLLELEEEDEEVLSLRRRFLPLEGGRFFCFFLLPLLFFLGSGEADDDPDGEGDLSRFLPFPFFFVLFSSSLP